MRFCDRDKLDFIYGTASSRSRFHDLLANTLKIFGNVHQLPF
jgi:hypothetical protein